jgi:hypothetical protein
MSLKSATGPVAAHRDTTLCLADVFQLCRRRFPSNEKTMAKFETRIALPQTREKVFEFLILTENLLQLIPPGAGMRVVAVPDVLQCGSRLEFQANAFGRSLKIVHEITECNSPARMVEEQIQGLFKRWVHEHLVEGQGRGPRAHQPRRGRRGRGQHHDEVRRRLEVLPVALAAELGLKSTGIVPDRTSGPASPLIRFTKLDCISTFTLVRRIEMV